MTSPWEDLKRRFLAGITPGNVIGALLVLCWIVAPAVAWIVSQIRGC